MNENDARFLREFQKQYEDGCGFEEHIILWAMRTIKGYAIEIDRLNGELRMAKKDLEFHKRKSEDRLERLDKAYSDLKDKEEEIENLKTELDLAKSSRKKAVTERNEMHEDLRNAEEYAWKMREEKEALIKNYAKCHIEFLMDFIGRLEKIKKPRSLMITSDYEPSVTMAEIDEIMKEMGG